MLQKVRDEFFGNSLTMIDFLGQFEMMAKKHFEPDRIYDLNRLCLVKRRLLDGGEREVLQFFNDRLELIEEISLSKKTSEQLAVNEFLSIGTGNDETREPEISTVMRQFFDRVISVSGSEGIARRPGGLSKILLDGETRTETYTDRPDIPLFEESEDGFQKVHPVSKAFKEDDEITVRTPFSEEPDLFSEIGMNPEREEDEVKSDVLKLDEEPEVLFTHSMIVVNEDDGEEEEEFTVFDGGIKVTPPSVEEEPAGPKEDELLDEFMETLVNDHQTEEVSEAQTIDESDEQPEEVSDEQPDDEASEEEPVDLSDQQQDDEASEEPGFESESVPQEMTYSGDEPEVEEPPVYEPVSGSDHFEVVEEMRENEEEPPHKKQRISIFDDFEEEVKPATEPVVQDSPVETIETVEAPEFTEETIETVEVPEFTEETIETVEAPEFTEETIETVETPEFTEEAIETVEVPEFTEEEIFEHEIQVEDEFTPEEVTEQIITAETEEETPDEVAEEVIPEEVSETSITTETEEETPDEVEEEGDLLFNEDFFDDIIEPEIPDDSTGSGDTSEETETPVNGDEPKKSEPEEDSGEIFHHISRDSIIETESKPDVELMAAIPEPIPVTEPFEPVTGATAGIKEVEKPMSSEEPEEKSTYSVLLKMLLLLGLMVATWFMLDATGLLKGKPASLNKEDLAKGAVVVTDSNSLADQREYPYNRDTQNDATLKGTVVKNGKYYEVAENGVLTAVDYDTSAKKQIKVTVPPDSLIAKNTTKDKKNGKGKESKDKEKDKATGAGNITLQDAVKNKVNEKKIADFVFKSGKKFYIQISAHRSFETAEKVAKDLKKKGYNSFVMKVKKEGVRGEDGIWYRVRVGPYDKEEKALEVNKSLNKNKKS